MNHYLAIDELFVPHYKYNISSYLGKHLLERYVGEYISEEEFNKLMTESGYKMSPTNKYKIRLRDKKYTEANYLEN